MDRSCNNSFHPVPPFSVNILWPAGDGHQRLPPPLLDSLLPGVYRDEGDREHPTVPHLSTPSLTSSAYLTSELRLGRLDGFSHHRFWLLGAPALPQPLHDCAHRGRTICVTERMDRHLALGLASTNRGGGFKHDLLYLKPLPRLLLDTRFWSEVLSCECRREDGSDADKSAAGVGGRLLQIAQATKPGSTPSLSSSPPASSSLRSHGSGTSSRSVCDKQHLWDCALGFLFSYIALVANESDFRIAQEHGLLPAEVSWAGWRILARQVAQSPDIVARRFHQRFLYGELRLHRLRELSQLKRGSLLPVLVGRLDRSARFFQNNVRWLASLVAYIAIVLTALQTGLTTDGLSTNGIFQKFALVFTVFSLIAPLCILLGFGLYFGTSLLYHIAVHLITSHLLVGGDGQGILDGIDALHHWDAKSEV